MRSTKGAPHGGSSLLPALGKLRPHVFPDVEQQRRGTIKPRSHRHKLWRLSRREPHLRHHVQQALHRSRHVPTGLRERLHAHLSIEKSHILQLTELLREPAWGACRRGTGSAWDTTSPASGYPSRKRKGPGVIMQHLPFLRLLGGQLLLGGSGRSGIHLLQHSGECLHVRAREIRGATGRSRSCCPGGSGGRIGACGRRGSWCRSWGGRHAAKHSWQTAASAVCGALNLNHCSQHLPHSIP